VQKQEQTEVDQSVQMVLNDDANVVKDRPQVGGVVMTLMMVMMAMMMMWVVVIVVIVVMTPMCRRPCVTSTF
jgi:hypothetical protein